MAPLTLDQDHPATEPVLKRVPFLALLDDLALHDVERAGTPERFKAGQGSFAADASAVILTSGVATKAIFVNGVAVVVQPLSGVMVEAAIGGQEFTYQAK